MLRLSAWFIWLILAILAIEATTRPAQQTKPKILTDITENGPLSHALIYAWRANDQFHVSEIAVHYAKLGDFEQALRVNESSTDEAWRTGAFSEIALEYWKQGQPAKAHELFIKVSTLRLPKDTIYIWGDVIEEMAQAELFDLALDTTAAMEAAGGSTAGAELAAVVEIFIEARKRNPKLPDILTRVIEMTKTVSEYGNEAIKKVAIAYAAQGQYECAIKLINKFDEDYDRHDGAHEIALELAKHGPYDRAVQLAIKAGGYYDGIALVGIASEALKRNDNTKALEITARIDSQISKAIKEKEDRELIEPDVSRLTDLVCLYSQLDHRKRAIELADIAFKIAKDIGKPGERYRSLQLAANTFCELGFYGKAIAATSALDYDRIQFLAFAEVGAHAIRKGKIDELEKIVKTIHSAPLTENEDLRAKALVEIASAGIEQGRVAEAQRLLLSIMPLVEKLETTAEQGPETRKNFAVAFAKTGDVRTAIQQIPKIVKPFYITEALIDIGLLSATKKLTLAETDVALLDELAIADLPAGIEPERLVNDAGWEIPGLANAKALRPPELQKTRDRSVQLYFTYYEAQVETFIKRPFPARRKPRREEANWISQGLKILSSKSV